MPWVPALPAADLELDAPRELSLDGQSVLLCRLESGVHAVHARCLHRGVSLADGSVAEGQITCSAHFWTFDLRSGACTQVPDQSLRVFNTKIEDGTVYVEV